MADPDPRRNPLRSMPHKDVSPLISSCTGCKFLLKEAALKDERINELQQKLKAISQISGLSTNTGLLNQDSLRKFNVASFNLGIEIAMMRRPDPVSTTLPFSSDSDSSYGSPDKTRLDGCQRLMNSHTPPTLKLFHNQAYCGAQKRGIVDITVQDIIDKVIEQSRNRQRNTLSNRVEEEKVFTMQEIIDNAVEKTQKPNKSSKQRKIECTWNFDTKLQHDRQLWNSQNSEEGKLMELGSNDYSKFIQNRRRRISQNFSCPAKLAENTKDMLNLKT